MGKIALETGGNGNVQILQGSSYSPDLRIPLCLKKNTNSDCDFSTIGSLTLNALFYSFRNFTINSGHQITLSPGLTVIECSDTFTCGGSGIIGQSGTLIGIFDQYNLETTGSNGSGGVGGQNGYYQFPN